MPVFVIGRNLGPVSSNAQKIAARNLKSLVIRGFSTKVANATEFRCVCREPPLQMRAFTLGVTPQCVGEMIFCVNEPQYAAQDPSFGYNI